MTTIDYSNLITNGDCYDDSLRAEVFTNSVIIREIAKECSLEDLKSFRLVSKTCHRASLSIWRRQATATLGSLSGFGRVEIQEFLKQVEKLQLVDAIPLRNFRLEFCSLPPDSLEKTVSLNSAEFRVLELFGHNMKHLTLAHCTFDQRKLLRMVCNMTPQLESLEILRVQRVYEGSCVEYENLKKQVHLKVLHISGRLPFPNWMFLEYFPNLKDIKLRRLTHGNLISDIADLRRQTGSSILNLKKFDTIRTEQSLHGFVEANLHLEHLSIRFERDIQENMSRDMMSSQCATLQSLRLFRFPLPNCTPLSTYPLQVNFLFLKELHLWGRVVSSFNFLKWMPSLKTLVVNLLCFDQYFDICNFFPLESDQPIIDPYFGDMVKASSILIETKQFQHSNLECLQIDFAFSVQSIKRLINWFPNMKIFKSILNNQTLQEIYTSWTKMEELHLLFGSNVTDEGITGITVASIVNKEIGQPSLLNLTALSNFSLECYCNKSSISDESAYNAFLRMPHLQNLRVCVSAKLSEDAEMRLMQRIPNVQILRNYTSSHTQIPINCCRRAAFHFSNKDVIEGNLVLS